MLTLQQLLESDSIASLVAKLNANFQTVSNSNGGPQGIRGTQGIPGLPGRLGPTGTTGPVGPTGTVLGIIPFAGMDGGTATVGPTAGMIAPNGQAVEPWPISSWVWLMWYYGGGVNSAAFPAGIISAGITAQGAVASHGDVFIDHANKSYWKYLDYPDEQGADDGVSLYPSGYTAGGYYGSPASAMIYPDLDFTQGWAGSGWYYYPQPPDTLPSSTVWVHDYSTYLDSTNSPTGPYPQGAFPYSVSSPLTVANARLITKYGTVWISSSSDNSTIANQDNFLETSDIGLSYPVVSPSLPPGRLNSGVDRLLFKMSLDSIPYLNNITARGYTAASGSVGTPGGANGIYPEDYAGDQMVDANFWVRPQYNVTMEKFTPLFFLSERNPDDAYVGNYSSIGLYMHTSAEDDGVLENTHKSLFLWSTRAAKDPNDLYPIGTSPIDSSSTENYGEFVMDVRRLIASNQYVCSVPADMKLSSDYIEVVDFEDVYNEMNVGNTQSYRTFQGYISSINGKSLTGDTDAIDYWEFGLGDGISYGITGGTHDTASGTAGMSTRSTWYGSSVLDQKPSEWETQNIGSNNYVRLAGMMERGRRFNAPPVDGGVYTTNFLSELIFYTSHFNTATSGLINQKGVTNDLVDPAVNAHKSLPVLYVSPFRNIGIGTFVGSSGDSIDDQGPLEPSAKLHVHVKQSIREDDPTYIYLEQALGSGKYSPIPRRVYAAAAFSSDLKYIPSVLPSPNPGTGYMTDILLGNLTSQDYEYVNPGSSLGSNVNPMSDLYGNQSGNHLRNAIRSESWNTVSLNTMHLGAQPGTYGTTTNTIGRNTVEAYRNEFQLSIHPLITSSATVDLTDSLQAISGVGIHNLYPRARMQFYGKNLYNEAEAGEEQWRPGYVLQDALATGLASLYPYYGVTASNSPSNNQVTVDYIGSSYTYPVGIYDYQYYAYGATANPSSVGNASANASAYPNRDSLGATRHAVPYLPAFVNYSYPDTTLSVRYLNSYKHGGRKNAWYEPTSYIGFNLYRDLSSASGTSDGDNLDSTRWILGTADNADITTGNNGGAALISSPHGELGIITIPSGRDGGSAYTQWEQRGLGTRDVLNQMKIIFDKNGNIAVGNAAGWDLDAYPSKEMNSSGQLLYVPDTLSTTTPAAIAIDGSQYTFVRYLGATGPYGRVEYAGYSELPTSSASLINAFATSPEYIRLEIGAEKAWSRDGRMAQKIGWGYPTNATIVIPPLQSQNYIKYSAAPLPGPWTLTTDNEGRIINNIVTDALGIRTVVAVVFPHPTEFNLGGPLAALAPGFTAPVGAIAAEWWGMSTENTPPPENGEYIYLPSPTSWTPIPTTDTRGSANVRLNNFVYGEGFGFGTGPQPNPESGGIPLTNYTASGNYTKSLVQTKRQESPKLILTFLEKTQSGPTADARPVSNYDPIKKVSTVIQSAQDEASLREYWIPKADNTGGTFMVFTDHFGRKEKVTGFDGDSIRVETTPIGGGTALSGLHLEQVVTQEFLAGYTGNANGFPVPITAGLIEARTYLDTTLFDNAPKSMAPGYVRYYNRNYRSPGQQETSFTAGQYGNLVKVTTESVGNTGVYPGSKNHYSEWALLPSGAAGATSNVWNTVKLANNINDTTIYSTTANNKPKWTNVDDSFTFNYPDAVSLTGYQGLDDGSMGEWDNGEEYRIVPSAERSAERIFNGSVISTTDMVKVTIDLSMTPEDTFSYGAQSPAIGFRLLPGADVTKNDFLTSGSPINAYGETAIDGEILIQVLTFDNTTEFSVKGKLEFFIDAGVWYDPLVPYWSLCALLYSGSALSLSGQNSILASNWTTDTDDWCITKMNVKIEEVDTYKGFHDHIDPIYPESIVNRASVQRNIDHFYSIYNPSTNFDNGWGTNTVLNDYGTPTIENTASGIRFKRINSEFVLVDYSITVKVSNPRFDFEGLGPAATNASTSNMIDQGSPRWTQYLRFIYVPDEPLVSEELFLPGRQNLAADLYGNGMWFSNWSSYKNWLPGSAVVGDINGDLNYPFYNTNATANGVPISTSADGGPVFSDSTNISNPTTFTRTWTGNFLEMTSHYNEEAGQMTDHGIFANNSRPQNQNRSQNDFGDSVGLNNAGPIRSGWGMDRRILDISKRMFPAGAAALYGNIRRFQEMMGMTYSLMGNRAYSRTRSTSWRFSPTNTSVWDSTSPANRTTSTNNSFVLEVMFDEPIMHIDLPMNDRLFGSHGDESHGGSTLNAHPYQYLTVSGQSIIRYAQTYSTPTSSGGEE